MAPPTNPKLGDKTVLRPRQAEMAPVNLKIETRSVSVHGPTSPMILVYSFLSIILVGTILLVLPFSSSTGNFTPVIDGFFTATSAVAVTGLVVVDTESAWSLSGQIIIMCLFFIGGLGFMTAAAFLLIIVGQQIGLQGKLILRAGLGDQTWEDGGVQIGSITNLVKKIALFSITTQILGVIFLFLRWFVFGSMYEGINWKDALWYSLFHSVSAFNNAGFDIIPDKLVGGPSLTAFSGDFQSLIIFSLLSILGGLSYVVLSDIASKRKFNRLRLDTKLILVGSVVVIMIGTLAFLATEWSNPKTLGKSASTEKIVSSIFHASSARTSGFSIIDYGHATTGNTVVSESIMFIGGASASTAGGIKIGTFMVIALAGIQTLRGRTRINAFGRTIPQIIIQRAFALGAMAFLMIIALFVALSIVQPSLSAKDAFFEIISAFGTVGLSTGITSELNSSARVLISVAMFLGRFGPLTLALLMIGKKAEDSYQLTQERVRIG